MGSCFTVKVLWTDSEAAQLGHKAGQGGKKPSNFSSLTTADVVPNKDPDKFAWLPHATRQFKYRKFIDDGITEKFFTAINATGRRPRREISDHECQRSEKAFKGQFREVAELHGGRDRQHCGAHYRSDQGRPIHDCEKSSCHEISRSSALAGAECTVFIVNEQRVIGMRSGGPEQSLMKQIRQGVYFSGQRPASPRGEYLGRCVT